MSAVMYDEAVARFARGELDWENADVRVALVDGRYQPSQSRDATREATRDYEVKGVTLPLRDRAVERGLGNDVKLMGGRVHWTGFTGEFRYAVLYDSVGDSLIAYADLGEQRATNSNVLLEYDREGGVATFTVESDGR